MQPKFISSDLAVSSGMLRGHEWMAKPEKISAA